MSSRRVSTQLNSGTYYVTLTVHRWYYLFDRFNRWQILADSLRYCQELNGLELNGYVFMLNHIHLIVTSPDAAGFLRDFKRHTSTQLKPNLETHEPRVLELFLNEQGKYHFWQETNAPKKIENPAFYLQKLNYILERGGVCRIQSMAGFESRHKRFKPSLTFQIKPKVRTTFGAG